MSDYSDRDDSLAAEKRRRIQRACDVCRRKKIKCDGPSMPDKICTNCKQYHYECKYIEQAKKRGPPKGYIESVETRLARMENLISRLAPGADFSAELGARIDKDNFNLAVHKQFEPTSSASAGSPSRGPIGSAPGPSRSSHSPACAATEVVRPWLDEGRGNEEGRASDEEEERALLQAMSRVQLRALTDDDQMIAGFAGKSSSLSLLLSARDYKYSSVGASDEFNDRLVSSRRPIFWKAPVWENSTFIQKHRQPWPPEDLAPTLVDLFFQHQQTVLPVLHEPTFRRQFADRLYDRDREFHQLALAVFACGSRYSSDERVRLPAELLPQGTDDTYRSYSAGWLLMGEIQAAAFDWNAPPTLFELQKLVLMTSFLTGSSHPRITFTIIGVGLRHCIDLGLHREHVLRAKPKAEAEQWKRAFWCLYGMDRSMAAIMGRPLGIHDEDIDVDYPLDVDDEFWGADFVQPADKPSRLSGFIAMLKLFQISGYCLRTVYSINKSKMMQRFNSVEAQQQLVAELDSALNSWLDSIPGHLKWDPHNTNEDFMQQSAHLYASYYATQIIVHRPFIPSATRPSRIAFPSLAICTNAARSGAHVIETARHKPRFCGSETVLALHGWTFSIVLLINIWGGKKSGSIGDPVTARADVEKMKRFFASLEQRWLMGGRLADVLHELASQGDLPPPDPANVVTPSQKRPRNAGAASDASATSPPPPLNAATTGLSRKASAHRSSADMSHAQGLFNPSGQPSPQSHGSPAASLHHSNASSSSFADPALDADILLHRHLPTQPQAAAGHSGSVFSQGAAPGAPGLQQQPGVGPNAELAQLYALGRQGQASTPHGMTYLSPGGFPPFGGSHTQQQPQQLATGVFAPSSNGLPDWMRQPASVGAWPQTAPTLGSASTSAGSSSMDNTLYPNAIFGLLSPTADGGTSLFGGAATGPPNASSPASGSQAQGNIQGLWENAPASFEVDEWSAYLSQFGPGP